MCCRSEWQERMYIYKWHEVDQTKHEIFCVHIVCNEIQVKVNLEITTFFFYLRFPYCPNFFWFGVVYNYCLYFTEEFWNVSNSMYLWKSTERIMLLTVYCVLLQYIIYDCVHWEKRIFEVSVRWNRHLRNLQFLENEEIPRKNASALCVNSRDTFWSVCNMFSPIIYSL